MIETPSSISARIAGLDWTAMSCELDNFGCMIVKGALTREECRSIASMYERDDIFRSTIVMARHGFGRGEYKYWSYPLPEIVAGLRSALYPRQESGFDRLPVCYGGTERSTLVFRDEVLKRAHTYLEEA